MNPFRPDIARIVADSAKPLTMTQIVDALQVGALEAIRARGVVLEMALAGEIAMLPAPVGSGTGTRWVYGRRA